MAKSLILRATNNTGSTIPAGKAVYLSGFDDINQIPYVSIASYDNEAKMPAVGIVREDLGHGATDVIKISGATSGFDTSGRAINTPVYVGRNGDITFDEPAVLNPSLITQQLGTVIRADDYPNGRVQLFPLEMKRSASHADLTNVVGSQHHFQIGTGGVDAAGAAAASGITGSGTAGHVTFWTGASNISGESSLFWDSASNFLGIGTPSPSEKLDVAGNIVVAGDIINSDLSETFEIIRTALDGYVTGGVSETTFQENKNFWNEAIHHLTESADGYQIQLNGLNTTELEHYNQHSSAIQTIIKDLDGYAATENQRWSDSSEQRQNIRDVLDGYNLGTTVSEHYNQHSEAIQTILKDLDGYATTENQRWTDSSGQRQDIRDALDGYASLTIENQRWSDSSEQRQNIRDVLDGYNLNTTVSEHYNQHSEAIQTILKDLDGYTAGGITATEGVDGYVAFFTGTNTIAGDNDLFFDRESHNLTLMGAGNFGIGTASPGEDLDIGDGTTSPTLRFIKTNTGTADIDFAFEGPTVGVRLRMDDQEDFLIQSKSPTETLNLKIQDFVRFIVEDGNVGIGIDSPSAKLHVAGDGYFDGYLMPFNDNSVGLGTPDKRWRDLYLGPDSLHISDGSGEWNIGLNNGGIRFRKGPDEHLRIDGAGNVGIGTTEPSDELHVLGHMRLQRGSINSVFTFEIPVGLSPGGIGIIETSRADASLQLTAGPNGSPTVGIRIFGEGWGTPADRGIIYYNAHTVTATSGGHHIFQSNGSEVVRIAKSGAVGIGTTDPDALLHVDGDGYFDGYLMPHTDNSWGLGTPSLRWRDLYLGPGSLHLVGTNTEWNLTIDNDSDIKFRQGSHEFLRITKTSGLVGIGTASPQEKIDVQSGALHFSFADPAPAPSGVLAGLGAGNVPNGTHNYIVQYVNDLGDNIPGTISSDVVVTDNSVDGQVTVTLPISPEPSINNRRLWRTSDGGTTWRAFNIGTIGDNTTTEYTDNTATPPDNFGSLPTASFDSGKIFGDGNQGYSIDSDGVSTIAGRLGVNAGLTTDNNGVVGFGVLLDGTVKSGAYVTDNFNFSSVGAAYSSVISTTGNDHMNSYFGYRPSAVSTQNITRDTGSGWNILSGVDGGANANNIGGIRHIGFFLSVANTATNNWGFLSEHRAQGPSASVDNYNAFYSYGNFTASGCTITNHYDFRVAAWEGTSNGTVDNRYGLYIDFDDATTANQFGVYQTSANIVNYFEGKLGLGTTRPHEALTVNGIVSLQEQDTYSRTHDGYGSLWAKSDGTIAFTNDSGTEFDLTSVGVSEITFQENKNFWNEAIHHLTESADGYASLTVENQRWIDSSGQRQDIRNVLDGYNLGTTVSEHYNQHSSAIQTILKDLDGYQTQLNGLDSTESEHYNQHSSALQTILKDLDGYQTQLSGLDSTESEHYNQHSEAIQTILKDLDGYSTGGVTATEGADGYLAFFTGATTIAGDNDLFFNRETHDFTLTGGGKLGIGTGAPTHSITLPSTSTGIAIYNTADQTTNFERGVFSWASSVLTLRAEAGGSGTDRAVDIRHGDDTGIRITSGGELQGIGSTGGLYTLTTGANAIGMHVQGRITSQNLPAVQLSNGSTGTDFSAASGLQQVVEIIGDINQSDTAGYTALEIDITETTTGSGIKNLIDAKVGGISQFFVSNAGTSTFVGNINIAGDIINNDLTETFETIRTAADGYAATVAASIGDGYVAFYDGDLNLAGDNDLFFDRATNNLTLTGDGYFGVGITPTEKLHISGNIIVTGQSYQGSITTETPVGTTEVINWENGNVAILDLESATGDVTLSFTNAQIGASYIIKIIQDSATARNITWHGSVLWQGGTAPTISTGLDSVDVVSLLYDGTNYYANIGQDYS